MGRSEVPAGLRLAASLQGRERDRLLRALAKLIVEREMEQKRMDDAREMARGRGGRRKR